MTSWKCCTCQAWIDSDTPDRLIAREVTGYAIPRAQGGQNHVLARRETGRVLCPTCTRRVQDGVDARQQELL